MSDLKIPFFNYPLLFAQRKKEYLRVLENVHSKGAFIMQQELKDFESELCNFLNVKYAFGVADGTMAILTSLMAAGIKKGDEVILPAHTFVATAAAIHHTGAKPVLADCNREHLIDPDSINERITNKTKAIVPVQLNGRICDMDKIMNIAEKNNLLIVEDSCQAFGATYKGRFAGTFGKAGTFSFFPAKTLGCFGDGGAVITNDDHIAKKVEMLRDHGRDQKTGKVKTYGFNSRLDNVQAAILSVKLKYYEGDIKVRRDLAKIYHDRLKDISKIELPPEPDSKQHFDVYQNYEIEVDDRDNLRKFLQDKGIGTIMQWGGFMLNNFDDLGLDCSLDFTDILQNRYLMLPMHHMLKKEEVNYICDQIESFYNN